MILGGEKSRRNTELLGLLQVLLEDERPEQNRVTPSAYIIRVSNRPDTLHLMARHTASTNARIRLDTEPVLHPLANNPTKTILTKLLRLKFQQAHLRSNKARIPPTPTDIAEREERGAALAEARVEESTVIRADGADDGTGGRMVEL
jgi:hypothetical protein